jgi:hypothetical protein
MKRIMVALILSTTLAIFWSFIIPSSSIAQSGCPNLAGNYQRNSDSLILRIIKPEKPCMVFGKIAAPAFNHELHGELINGSADFYIARRNTANNCLTIMYGKLSQTNSRDITTEIYGTDGKCDLPSNYTESSIWKKK